jgi:hypothetical protein
MFSECFKYFLKKPVCLETCITNILDSKLDAVVCTSYIAVTQSFLLLNGRGDEIIITCIKHF